jgi:hypothetical protein
LLSIKIVAIKESRIAKIYTVNNTFALASFIKHSFLISEKKTFCCVTTLNPRIVSLFKTVDETNQNKIILKKSRINIVGD